MNIQKHLHRFRDSYEKGKVLGLKHAPKTLVGRACAWALLALFVVSTFAGLAQQLWPVKAYALNDAARAVLPQTDKQFAELLKFDGTKNAYMYNASYDASASGMSSGPRFMATLHQDASKGITVTDPVNNLDFTTVPQFALGAGRQDTNQIMYPLVDAEGFLVYTAQVASVKENILLPRFSGDNLTYAYDLKLPDGTEARLNANGTVGIYGGDLPLTGAVSAGTPADQKLLETARKNIKKTKLLFSIPAPVVKESGKNVSSVKTHYELVGGTHLKLVAGHLKGASYPLAIDPSVYISSAQKLMRGNNETNIDFDTSNNLIEKGKLSGGRFNSWNNTLTLPVNLWSMGTAVTGGYMYVAGGMSSNTRVSTVYWAQLDPTANTITSPTPGTSTACANWCTNSVYNLPVALSDMQMVAYSGYLYVMGGVTGSGGTNTLSSAIYIAKLGANGEPQLWHPTDPNQANWVYWYSAGNITVGGTNTPVYDFSAVAYNNRMYLAGGRTTYSSSGASNAINTISEADISPVGTLSSWTTTGMLTLPSIRHSFNMQVYNDRMYVIGGNSGGVIQSTVQYAKVNNDGTMSGPWVTTTNMLNPRYSNGGNFAVITNGYLYVAGGCSAVIGAGDWCSVAGMSADRDIELASINADGSITAWTAITGITYQRSSYGFLAWRQTLYGIGGCTAPNETTGLCTTETNVANYGVINADGDVSTTNNSVASGTAPCSGTTPTNCNIPPAGASAGQIGNMVDGVAINNGYIYLIGGCTAVSATSNCYNNNKGAMSPNIAYAALAVDGSVVSPATCPFTLVGTWCVDSTNTINPTAGEGAVAATVFNNTIYVIGGTDGSNWSSTVYYNTFNANGSLAGAWNAQAFSTIGLGTPRGFMYAYSRANPAAASTDPGVLWVIGGCNNGTKSNGIPCTTFFNSVYKCLITTSGAIDATTLCTTTGQIQLDSENNGANAGLSGMAGTVYAGYMYLMGGQSPNQTTRGQIMYAQIDNNNNIVAAPGGAGKWIFSPNQISPARQRNAAFGYNGYLYSLAGYNGTGSLNDVLYTKINVNDGSIGTFTTSQVTVNPRWGLMSVVSNGFVYAMGGCSAGAAPTSCTTMTQTVQTFQLYNNYSGTPAGYNAINNTGVDRVGGGSVVLNGYLYFAGGCSDMACTTATNNVYYAQLGADGSVGTFTAATNNLPAVRAWGKLVASGGTLYYVGGQDSSGAAQSTVYYSTPASGVPAAWGTATNGLPATLAEVGVTVWDSQIYVAGGVSGGTRQTSIYISPKLSTGGDITSAWSSGVGFNIARSGVTAISYANTLYVAGGFDGTNYLNDVQYIKINSNGTLTGNAWTYTTSLPQRVYQADGYASNGYIYIFGGRSTSTSCTNNTYISSISANTPIANGNNPTGIGEWSQTNVAYTGARYGQAVANDQGRAYVIGGGCNGAFVAAGNRSYYTTMQSQPAVAKYSRAIDTSSDVYPTKWLINGLDNDVGARWQLKYRSMTNPFNTSPSTMCAAAVMNGWGQEINYGTVTLGSPNVYTVKDGGGTTIPCARYYYFSLSIDSSKAFGYPDDVTRGPTVKDLSLFFTADPSKRLRHGGTFTSGQLQPLDTPF